MELIDIVDANGMPTGKTIEKREAHTRGTLHRGSHIWAYDDIGSVFLQRRARMKGQNPGAWDIIAGHTKAGEDPVDTAIRELYEEIGIAASKDALVSQPPRRYVYRSGVNHCDVIIFPYLLRLTIPVESCTLQREEVDAVQYVDMNELERDVSSPTPIRTYAQEPAYWQEIISTLRAI